MPTVVLTVSDVIGLVILGLVIVGGAFYFLWLLVSSAWEEIVKSLKK